ncbi:hypothetical protein H634G_10997 [Metarhizium anisopliae BRIP 53293]|uniref:Reverse transcriptase domain-containing protein n=1 Tax=Metarhizium anisopliae BRIP 53293 TaxID=1291518 RepID=A0A0D9NJ28_METAN|nr:hypothetical protein H634G_10997 [Metarhizium anisopliae BRIP 53293]
MAMATSSPPCKSDPFDLGIYTPKNVARGARAALLRDSSPVEITDIGVSPVRGRLAQTPSSPLTRICNAVIAEGQQLDEFPTLPSSALQERQSPIDITEAADQLADEQTAAHNAKIRVFRTFCTHFNRVAEEFPSGLERDFAQHFSVSFLEFWKQALGSTPSASTPTYGSRSAVDLVAALVHDIEEAFAHKQVVTLVTADIQGAFDSALRNRLVLRLREQGWPDNVARWAGSFMSGRSARVRYQDVTTPTAPLQCGLPQGSPVSPILFLLYTEPIYRLGKPEGRFGYADDAAILCIGESLQETARKATECLEELVAVAATATATGAAIATASPIRSSTTSSVYPQRLPTATHRQGQRAPVPPREDLRVFVRLDADAPARNHIGYAIRAHVASKTGLELNKIPQVVQVNIGWAIRAVDKTTRDLLLERQAEWADDLGASAVEASQKWHTYAVNNCPRRLTDLYGNELDYDTAVRDEINHQTGLTPVSIRIPRRDNEQLPYKTLIISFLEPTKRPWSLFGTSRPARLIENNNPPKQSLWKDRPHQ